MSAVVAGFVFYIVVYLGFPDASILRRSLVTVAVGAVAVLWKEWEGNYGKNS